MPAGLTPGFRGGAWKIALAGTVVMGNMAVSGSGAGAQVTAGPPQFIGRWSSPFEEGGLDTPLCSTGDGGQLQCKPVAQASSVLPDGRVFYFNGLEGQEQNAPSLPTQMATELRNSTSRLLDLRSGVPEWSTPSTPDGSPPPTSGPSRETGPVETVAGIAGVPGGPGDGLVGTAWGLAGGPTPAESAPPNDAGVNDSDMFCADVTSLPDGRLLIAGGADWYNEPDLADGVGIPEAQGVRSTRIFDPATNTFTAGGAMRHNRFYPSLVTLPDGKVLAAGGVTKRVKNTQLSGVRRTETFDPATNEWTGNYTSLASETSLPLAPRLHLMLNGKVLYTGAGQSWAPFGAAADQALFGFLRFYDPATGRWEMGNQHILGMRDGAASVLLPLDPPYQRADILTAGGTLGPPPGGEVGVPLSTLTRVDRTGRITEEITRFNMLEGRWFPSAVNLPDGTVMVAGGASTSDTTVSGTGVPVRTVELFDLRTETWYSMARISRDRTYHHSAVLLPDGRVLLGGHAPETTALGAGGDLGGPFPNNDRDPSFEIFSPHYLFRGARPVINSVPAGIAYGETFNLTTRQALSADSVVLMRLPSAQHGIDSDMRTVRLAFSRASNRLKVVAPPDGTVAPPGYYYLFLNQQSRRGPIPSMARIVRVGGTHDPAEAIQPFADDRVPEGAAHDDVDRSLAAPVTEAVDEVIGEGEIGSRSVVSTEVPEGAGNGSEQQLAAEPTGFAAGGDGGSGPDPLPVAAVAAAALATTVELRWRRRRRR